MGVINIVVYLLQAFVSCVERIPIVDTAAKQKKVRNCFAKAWISRIFSADVRICHFLQIQNHASTPVKYLPPLLNTHPYLWMGIMELSAAAWYFSDVGVSLHVPVHVSQDSHSHHGFQCRLLASLHFQINFTKAKKQIATSIQRPSGREKGSSHSRNKQPEHPWNCSLLELCYKEHQLGPLNSQENQQDRGQKANSAAITVGWSVDSYCKLW